MNEKTAYYLKLAKLRLPANIESIECNPARNLTKQQQGYKTTYLNMNRLIEKVTLSKLDGSYIRLLNHLEKQTLIILDDFGLQNLGQEVRLTLLQLLEDRYGKKSLIVTSQLPVAKWYEYINDPTLADAILDRLRANAHRIELKGESLRRKKMKSNQ